MGWFSSVGEWFKGGTIGAIANAISAPITAYQVRQKEITEAKHKMELADFSFKTQLIMNRESHNQAWEIEALKNSTKKRSPMQWVTFLVLGAPFVIAWFNPALVAAYFTVSLKVIPLWYQQAFLSIIGVIWGIANLKNAANGINKALLMRRNVDVTKMMDIPAEKIIRPDGIKRIIDSSPVNVIEKIIPDNELHDLYPDLKNDN